MSEEAVPPERDVKDFRFQQLCRFRIVPSPSDLPKDNYRLIAASSQYGLLFVGYNSGFKVIKPAELSKIDQSHASDRTTVTVDSFPVVADVRVTGHVSYVVLSADDLSLAVVVSQGDLIQAFIYDVRVFADQSTPKECFLKVRLTTGGTTVLADLAWNPVQPNTLVTILSDGSICLYEIADRVHIVASVPSASATCVCWSPKGRQLVVGTTDGKLVQYDQELKKKREWTCPDLLIGDRTYKVVGVIWLSTYEFLAAYLPDNCGSSDQPDVVLIKGMKEGPTSYQNFEDPCFGNGEDREKRMWFQYLQKWNILVASSSNACETAVIGKHFSEETSWERWNLDDSARAELPLTDDHSDSFPMGLAIDVSSEFPIPQGEGTLPPSPILFLLSTDGVIVPYYMIYRHPGATAATVPPKPLDTTGMRKPTGVLETDAAIIPPSISTGQTTTSSLSTGLATGPSFQFVTPTSVQSTQSSGLSFGSAKPNTSGFGINTKPAFGTGATFSAVSSTSSGSAVVSSTAPSFSFLPQGTTASTAKPAPFSFSGSLGTPSSGSGGSAFNFSGGTSTTTAPNSASFKATTSTSSSQATFGLTSTAGGSNPASSFSGFASSTATTTSAATAFTFGSATPKSTAPAVTSTSGFSFTPMTSNVATPVQPKSGGANFALQVEPRENLQTPGSAPPMQLSNLGGTRVEVPVQPQPERPVQPQPERQGQPQQPSGFAGFVTSTQNSISTTNTQATSGFKGFIHPLSTQSTKTTAGSPNVSAQPPTSQSANFSLPQAKPPAPPTPKTTAEPPSVASSQTNEPPGYRPPTSVIQQQERTQPSRPVMPTAAPVQPNIAPTSGEQEDTFSKSILEEFAHFEQEMADFRARAGHGRTLVGSQSEIQQLKSKVDEVMVFTSEITSTTKDQCKEIEDQKASYLDLFAMVEDCRARDSRNVDNKYLTLLKAQALDPSSQDHLRQLQQQYQVLDQGLRDVDAILDQQWAEHQNKNRNKNRIKAPTTDVIYQVLKSHNTLIRNQKSNLDNLERKLKELKLYNKTSSWQHADSSKTSRDQELSSLADSLLEVNQTTSSSSTQISIKSSSPEKQARLREYLARRTVPKIKSTRPENLSLSRIATVDRRRHDLEETTVSELPNRTLQTYAVQKGSILSGTVNSSFGKQPENKPAPSVGGPPPGMGFYQGSRPVGHFTGPQTGQTRQGLMGQSLDFGKKNMPQPSSVQGLPNRYTFTAASAVPGGLKNLGHIVVEDITPPSSTGYEEEDEDDEDEDEYDEDDEEYAEEEDENEVGFFPQYSLPAKAGEDVDKGFNVAYTPKFGGFNANVGNAGKNLFGTSSLVTTKPSGISLATVTKSTFAGFSVPTTSVPKTSFGTKPAEFSFVTQANPSFNFTGSGTGTPSTFAFGGAAKPTGFTVAGGLATSKTTTTVGDNSRIVNSAFTSTATKTSPVTTTSTNSTGFSIGGGTVVSSEETSPEVTSTSPLLLEALTKDEDDTDTPITSTTASSTETASGFTFTKPVQSSITSTTASSTETASGFTFTKPVQSSVSDTTATGGVKKDSGTSQPFGLSTSISGSLFRVQTSSSIGTVSNNVATTTVTVTTTVVSAVTATTASSFTGFGISSSGLKSSTAAGSGTATFGKAVVFGKTDVTSTVSVTSPTPTTAASFGGSGGLFGKPSATSAAIPQVASKSIVSSNTAATSGNSALSEKTAASVTSVDGGTSSAGSEVTHAETKSGTSTLFGHSAAIPASTTSEPSSSASSGGLFGTATSLSSKGGLFGVTTSSSPGGLFGTSTSLGSTGGLFGTTTSSSTGGLFGTATSLGSTSGLFGTTTSSSTGGLFGTATSVTSSNGAFKTPTTTTTTTTTTNSTGGLLGTALSTTNTGGLFGTATSTSSAGGSMFGAMTTTTTALFGNTSSAATTAAVSNSATPLFGDSTSTASAGLFGQSTPSTAPTGFGAFSTPTFGQSATFGQSGQSSSIFGQPVTTQAGFGQSPFDNSQSSSQNQQSGGGGLFSGLGGQPTAEKVNTNVFGATSFGAPSTTSTASLFGSKAASGFGTAGSTPSSGGSFSGFSMNAGGVGSTGFGISKPQGQGGFGSAPSFGGSPTFGSSVGGFGAQPAFGGGAAFGSSPTFASPVGGSPNAGSGGFAGFASSNSPTFGSLAGSSDAPTFGSLGTTGGGGGGFGSPAGFGGASAGFGSSPSQGFGNNGDGNSSFGSSPAFSGYRS